MPMGPKQLLRVLADSRKQKQQNNIAYGGLECMLTVMVHALDR
jgi:hypothetical protein